MKTYISLVKFIDSEVITITHQTLEDRDEYLQELAHCIEELLVTMVLSRDENGEFKAELLSK